MKFVSPISDIDRQVLNHVLQQGDKPVLRRRVHAILLSDEGYVIKQISAILAVTQQTVSTWFNAWSADGLSGLSGRPHSGRPAIYNNQDLTVLKMLAAETPHQIKVIRARLLKETGKTASTRTISRALKRLRGEL